MLDTFWMSLEDIMRDDILRISSRATHGPFYKHGLISHVITCPLECGTKLLIHPKLQRCVKIIHISKMGPLIFSTWYSPSISYTSTSCNTRAATMPLSAEPVWTPITTYRPSFALKHSTWMNNNCLEYVGRIRRNLVYQEICNRKNRIPRTEQFITKKCKVVFL